MVRARVCGPVVPLTEQAFPEHPLRAKLWRHKDDLATVPGCKEAASRQILLFCFRPGDKNASLLYSLPTMYFNLLLNRIFKVL